MLIVAVVTQLCFVALIMLFETLIIFIKTGFFIRSRFVLNVSFEDVV
jgi:hypothetical protein